MVPLFRKTILDLGHLIAMLVTADVDAEIVANDFRFNILSTQVSFKIFSFHSCSQNLTSFLSPPLCAARDLTAGSYQFGLIKSAFTDTLADLVNFPSLPTAITLNHSFFTSSTLTTYINDGYSSSSVTITLKNLHTSLSCSSSFSPESHESSLTTVPNSIQSSPKEVSTSNTLYKIGLYLQPELIEKRTFINNVWEEGGVAILVND